MYRIFGFFSPCSASLVFCPLRQITVGLNLLCQDNGKGCIVRNNILFSSFFSCIVSALSIFLNLNHPYFIHHYPSYFYLEYFNILNCSIQNTLFTYILSSETIFLPFNLRLRFTYLHSKFHLIFCVAKTHFLLLLFPSIDGNIAYSNLILWKYPLHCNCHRMLREWIVLEVGVSRMCVPFSNYKYYMFVFLWIVRCLDMWRNGEKHEFEKYRNFPYTEFSNSGVQNDRNSNKNKEISLH